MEQVIRPCGGAEVVGELFRHRVEAKTGECWVPDEGACN